MLYNSIVENPATRHGRAGFYFSENDEHRSYEVSEAVSEAMLAIRKGEDFGTDAIRRRRGQAKPVGE